MKVYKYIDYNHYKKTQVAAFKRKESNSWVKRDYIDLLIPHIVEGKVASIKGLCHGTRNGREQQFFKASFQQRGIDAEVVGTEIAASASEKYPLTIAWDFHDVKEEWLNKMDFIYSNALDHSYKPKECITSWLSCLNDDGVCIIEWSTSHRDSHLIDPFGATFEELEQMLEELGSIKERLKTGDPRKPTFYLVQRKKR